MCNRQLLKHRLSYNVGGVKLFLSVEKERPPMEAKPVLLTGIFDTAHGRANSSFSEQSHGDPKYEFGHEIC
jgi:hypothetical protein